MAVLQITGRRRCTELVEVSEFDVGDDESAAVISTRLGTAQMSSHGKRETGTHDCGSGGEL